MIGELREELCPNCGKAGFKGRKHIEEIAGEIHWLCVCENCNVQTRIHWADI